MKRRLLALCLCAALLTSCAGMDQSAAPAAGPAASAIPTATPLPTPTATPDPEVAFSASGDNLIHGQLYLQARRRTGGKDYDFAPLYASVADFYRQQDLNFINQETLVNDELEPSTYPLFSSPGAVGRAAYDAGFRLFGTSNNHIYYRGAAGIAATRRFWASMPSDALAFGLWENGKEDEIPLCEKNGITFACLAYTQYTNGLPTPRDAEAHIILTSDTATIERQIEKARTLADVVLVSVHWGTENSHTVTDGQWQLAQQMADWGADLIIGTHPHVLQGAEWLTKAGGGQAFVAYSLGNFVSAQSQPDQLIGAVLSCRFVKQADGTKIENVRFLPVVTDYGQAYRDVRVVFLSDYTADQAQAHGVRAAYPAFSLDYINKVVAENLPAEFLQ